MSDGAAPEAEERPAPAPVPAAPKPSRAWPVALVLVMAMVMASGLYIFHRVSRAPVAVLEEGRKTLSDLRSVAAAFRTGTITTTFLSHATEVSGSQYLQFAHLQQQELFERRETATALWGYLELPEVVVAARAPVDYTYYLDLQGRWQLSQSGNTVVVVAPPIRFNPPAVDASALEFEVKTGSLLRDEAPALEALKQGLTRMARRRARENVPLIREIGRREVEDFVEAWLIGRYLDGDDYKVKVFFPDEKLPAELQATPPVEIRQPSAEELGGS